jgi:ribosomal protein S18 acetylase RimI-like enzyme
MKPVTTAAEVLDALQRAKTGAANYRTNCFAAQPKLQSWIDHGELLGEFRDRVTFFARKDRDFWHWYFCAPDVGRLEREAAEWPFLRTERVAVDLVGTEANLRELLRVAGDAGFRPYARLLRLARASQPGQADAANEGSEVAYAEKADCQAVMNLLDTCFDRYADQLPMPYEIEAAIAARQVLVVKRDGTVGALLFFETQGLTSTIRYWVVAQRFRSHGFGSVLMRHYLTAQSAARRFILWVTADNENAVLKYRHYGYGPDGLVDHVLVNELIGP